MRTCRPKTIALTSQWLKLSFRKCICFVIAITAFWEVDMAASVVTASDSPGAVKAIPNRHYVMQVVVHKEGGMFTNVLHVPQFRDL